MSISKHLLSTLVASLLLVAPSLAFAQDAPPLPNFESIDDIIDFLENYDGTPEEFQKIYESLPTEERALVDSSLESWSLEGGLLLGGGLRRTLGHEHKNGGIFRLGASIGAVWPMGKYALPVYYALPEIPGPWAIGFQAFAATDNFDSLIAGGHLRWAYEYIGTTPYIELGPALHLDGDGAAGGASVELGYGNILFQGYVQGQYFLSNDGPLTVTAGVRIPWLLATAL